MSKWGPGTGTTETDYVNNLYAGLDLGTSSTLHTTSRYNGAAADTATVTYRAAIDGTLPAGAYSEIITYTGVANP